MGKEPGLRERKKRATREAISAAAVRLAAEAGPDAITIEQIAEAANVSPRTFFNYFASKEDAILNADPERPAEWRALVLARPPDEPPLEALRQAMLEAAEDVEARAELAELRREVIRRYPALYPRYVAAFAAVEHEMIEAMAKRTGLDAENHMYPSLVVAAGVTAMRLAAWRRTHGEARPLAEVVTEAFELLREGLKAPLE